MDNSFLSYLQLLEILAFFAGYPLFYLLVQYLIQLPFVAISFKKTVEQALAPAYACCGLLFVAFELKNAYPEFRIEAIYHPIMLAWGLCSTVFLFPPFRQKNTWLLFHSIPFFAFFAKMLFLDASLASADNSMIKNGMRIYSISLGFHFVLCLLVIGFYHLKNQFSK